MILKSQNLKTLRDWNVMMLNIYLATNVSRIIYRVIIRGKPPAYVKDVTGTYVVFILFPLMVYSILHYWKGYYLETVEETESVTK